MPSSGLTGGATTDDSAVELIAYSALRGTERNASIVNEGTVAGFFSLDGKVTWDRLPALYEVPRLNRQKRVHSVWIKRIASGSNLSSVFATVW